MAEIFLQICIYICDCDELEVAPKGKSFTLMNIILSHKTYSHTPYELLISTSSAILFLIFLCVSWFHIGMLFSLFYLFKICINQRDACQSNRTSQYPFKVKFILIIRLRRLHSSYFQKVFRLLVPPISMNIFKIEYQFKSL